MPLTLTRIAFRRVVHTKRQALIWPFFVSSFRYEIVNFFPTRYRLPHSPQAASTTTWTMWARTCTTTRSSRCLATGPSGTTSRRRPSAGRGSCSPRCEGACWECGAQGLLGDDGVWRGGNLEVGWGGAGGLGAAHQGVRVHGGVGGAEWAGRGCLPRYDGVGMQLRGHSRTVQGKYQGARVRTGSAGAGGRPGLHGCGGDWRGARLEGGWGWAGGACGSGGQRNCAVLVTCPAYASCGVP